MTRLLLLAVLCLLTWIYFPESRAILEEAAEPVTERVMRPFTDLGALDEMERVGRNVVSHERLTGELPADEGAWQAWLDARYRTAEVGRDQWGATYRLLVWPDSVGIVSYGPDGLPDTRDDLKIAMPRG
jgi:hypothetical protein